MADDEDKTAKASGKAVHEPPAGAEMTATWRRERCVDRLHGERKVDRPAQEGEAVGGDLLGFVCRGRDEDRPVTFVFNGGPGASSAYLHMGAVGPSRVVFPANGSLPQMPPRLVTNEESWLAFTDLVFVDPVGTGFSRVIEDETEDSKKDKTGTSATMTATRRSISATSAISSRCVSSWAGGSPVTAAGGLRCSSPARAMAATASAGWCAWCRRRRASD